MPVVVEEGLEHIQHPGHLCEDKDPVMTGLEFPQQHVKVLQLATVILYKARVRELCHHGCHDRV